MRIYRTALLRAVTLLLRAAPGAKIYLYADDRTDLDRFRSDLDSPTAAHRQRTARSASTWKFRHRADAARCAGPPARPARLRYRDWSPARRRMIQDRWRCLGKMSGVARRSRARLPGSSAD